MSNDGLIFKQGINKSWSCAGLYKDRLIVLDSNQSIFVSNTKQLKIKHYVMFNGVLELMFASNQKANEVYLWLIEEDKECYQISREEFKCFVNL